jgi:hypothetical protein
MQANTSTVLKLPATIPVFIHIGRQHTGGRRQETSQKDQTGWLDRFTEKADSEL